jgi:ERCC4-type nuclease
LALPGKIGIRPNKLLINIKKKTLSKKERLQFILESFPGIGPTLAKSLLKEFKTIKNIINSEEKVLQKVDKLGPKKSTEIKYFPMGQHPLFVPMLVMKDLDFFYLGVFA